MFNFFKKKEKQVDLTVNKQHEQDYTPFADTTKPADNTASFEIPDFTEDDLNFDLGLGEFMPGKDQSIINTQEIQTSSAPSQTSYTAQADSNFVQPIQTAQQIQPAQSQVQNDDTAIALVQDASDEELPEFQVFPSLESTLDFGAPARVTQRKILPSNAPLNKPKQNVVKQEVKPVQMNPVQIMAEGKFMPKEDYVKTILLSDELVNRSAVAQSQIAGIISTSEAQSIGIEDLRNTARTIGGSLMIADSKLFGDGDGK